MKEIQLQFYPRHVYITTDAEEFKNHETGDTDISMSAGCTSEYVDHEKEYFKGAIIYIDLKAQRTPAELVGTIAHEALHAVNCIFFGLDIEYDLNNDEHAAYLLGYIAEECYKYVTEQQNKEHG